MYNTKGINGIKAFGYILIAFILVGIGFLSAMPVQNITRPSEPITVSNNEAAKNQENPASIDKHSDKDMTEPARDKSEAVPESVGSKTTVTSKIPDSEICNPPAGILDIDAVKAEPASGKDFANAHITTDKKPESKKENKSQKIQTAKTSPPEKQRIPSIKTGTWAKSENTGVYVIHGNKRIDPYTGNVLETIDSTGAAVRIPVSKKKTVTTLPENQSEKQIINNYYYSNNKEAGKQTDDNKQAAIEDKEFWHGGYSAISRNPQTTIGEAYRERLKNWPNGNDMSYCGPDNYYGGYSSSSGYVNLGNIYLPTNTGGYGRSYGTTGYVKIGNIYLPVSGGSYRR